MNCPYLVPGLCHEALQGFRTAGNEWRPLVSVNSPQNTEIIAANFYKEQERLNQSAISGGCWLV
jgi:hypothetical protein